MRKERERGIVLITAVVISFILLLWAVAALYRASFQTSSVMFSHRKSESYYLAKRAVSRSLFFLNGSSTWVTDHNSRDSADDFTDGALCWVETVNSQLVLKCEASVGSQLTELSIPLTTNSRTDTHVYSVSPSVAGGPDVISWTTENTADWKTLPPIPNATEIESVVGTDVGDVYAIAKDGSNTILWRYREGKGWVQMPDLPSGVSISQLSVGRSERLIALGTDGTGTSLMMLPIDSGLSWDQIAPPPSATLERVTMPTTSSDRAYAVTDLSGPGIHQYDFSSGSWTSLPLPTAAHFDSSSGGLINQIGDVPNLSGGIAVNEEGDVFVASNPGTEPSVIYEFEVPSAGSTSGNWRVLPPVPAFVWISDTDFDGEDVYSTNLKDLAVDDEGMVWVQQQNPITNDFATIQIDPGNR